ncbi:FAD-binding protein [Nocardia sp. NPDC101769]|uniref:FAD-binding protein n=1 Tax=Nocardia sp. NPDC101769 TaxID=3364333 RepID=UPI003824713D
MSTTARATRAQHDRTVDALRTTLRSVGSGQVRLQKTTSNLFRPRSTPTGPTLDVRDLDHFIDIDTATGVLETEGMITYEDLVDVTLCQGFMPPVVLDFKTITLGGAATGLGAESSSFRNGLPHSPIIEMDILTGDGGLVTATRDNEYSDLFYGFPHSYGSLGYSLRLKLQLERVKPYVQLHHVRFGSADDWTAAMLRVFQDKAFDGFAVDFMDGIYFKADEIYLVLGTFVDEAPFVSDYTGQQIYYRSVRSRSVDYLTVRDYLWRYDTDMYWTSKVFGLENPIIRGLWPRRARNTSVYRKLQMFDREYRFSDRLNMLRGKRFEWVLQDADVPAEATGEFTDFLATEVGITPMWLCPFRCDDELPLYPLDAGRAYVSIGFWWTVPLEGGQDSYYNNKLIEDKITELGGLKPLYSTAHYSEEEFWNLFGGEEYHKLKSKYDPMGRFPNLYEKCVLSR